MLENCKEDFPREELERIYISLFTKDIRVGIVGGGRAATIKTKTLINKNVYVEILSREFSDEILELNNKKLKLVKEPYSEEFIKDKHLIIIAVDDEKLIKRIRSNCDKEYKLYIDCTNFKDGMGAIPVQKELNNISFGLSTKQGNPKGALLAADLAFKSLMEIDDFIGFTGTLREKVKKITNKDEIMTFIVTDDFKFFWDKRKDEIILKLFFNEEYVKDLYKYLR